MKKYLFIIPFLFLGCDTPQEKNKKEIEKIQKQITKLTQEVNALHKQQILLKNRIDSKNKKIVVKQENNSSKNEKIQKQITQLQKQIKEINTTIKRDVSKITKTKNGSQCNFDYIVIKPTTFITKIKTPIFSSSKNGKVLFEWASKITFTSYKEKNNFVKVTGYFIDGKWVPNKKEWWIKKSDVVIKRLDHN